MSFQSGSGGTSKKLRPKFAALQTPYPDQKPFFSKALCSMKGLGKLGVRCLVGGGTVASVVLVALALLAGCAAVTFACWHYCERGYTACRHDHNGSRNLLSRSVFPGIGTARTCLILVHSSSCLGELEGASVSAVRAWFSHSNLSASSARSRRRAVRVVLGPCKAPERPNQTAERT